jgi:hypothetical protein
MFRHKWTFIAIVGTAALVFPPSAVVAEPLPEGFSVTLWVPAGAIQDDRDVLVFTGGEVTFGTLPGCVDAIVAFQEAILVEHGNGDMHRGIVAVIPGSGQFQLPITPGTRVSDLRGESNCIDDDSHVHRKFTGTTK